MIKYIHDRVVRSPSLGLKLAIWGMFKSNKIERLYFKRVTRDTLESFRWTYFLVERFWQDCPRLTRKRAYLRVLNFCQTIAQVSLSKSINFFADTKKPFYVVFWTAGLLFGSIVSLTGLFLGIDIWHLSHLAASYILFIS